MSCTETSGITGASTGSLLCLGAPWYSRPRRLTSWAFSNSILSLRSWLRSRGDICGAADGLPETPAGGGAALTGSPSTLTVILAFEPLELRRLSFAALGWSSVMASELLVRFATDLVTIPAGGLGSLVDDVGGAPDRSAAAAEPGAAGRPLCLAVVVDVLAGIAALSCGGTVVGAVVVVPAMALEMARFSCMSFRS